MWPFKKQAGFNPNSSAGFKAQLGVVVMRAPGTSATKRFVTKVGNFFRRKV